MTGPNFDALGAGLGLRLPHLQEVVATRPDVGWFEIHPETFLANPHAIELLVQVADRYPISVHTVGVSIGSAHGVDVAHLRRVKSLVDLLNPFAVSGHIAWSTHPGEYLNDLVPLPYDDESLQALAEHIRQVQDTLGRPYLLENPSSYVGYGSSTMTEPQFLVALVGKTGCFLLCDVSNVYLSGRNMGFDPYTYLDAMPAAAIRELHLGGFTEEDDEATPGGTVLVDTHGARIDEAAWDLYAYAVERFGRRPTLIEWDNDIPPLGALLVEAQRADEIAAKVATGSRHVAAG